MIPHRMFPLAALWLLLSMTLFPAEVLAQQGPPYTLEQLEGYLAVGLSTELILSRVQRDCLDFRVDARAEERLRAVGADDAFLEALRGVCYLGPEEEEEPPVQPEPEEEPEPEPLPQPEPAPPPTAALLHNPGSAALKSLFLPGLGQFSTGRPAVGGVFLAGWAGALAFGILSQEVTVECLDRVTESCPANQVLRETVKRPMLPVGVGGAVALAVVSALEARSGAAKANVRQMALGEGANHGGVLVELLPLGVAPAALLRPGGDLVLVQLRF